MKKIRRVLQNLKKKDDAIAGIIVAILLVGLIISVLAIIQTVYVPRWMEQKEAEHLYTVLDQFALLKFAIDNQALNENSNISLSTSITLGSKEWPIFSSSRAYGTLEVKNEGTSFTIKKNDAAPNTLLDQDLGTVTYSSSNAYFLDKTYVYETGALISSQSDGNVMSIVPNFFVSYDNIEEEVDISFSIINTIGIGEKTSIGGYGTYPIQSRYKEAWERTFPEDVTENIRSFSITTNYENSWDIFFTSKLEKAGLVKDTDFEVTSTGDGIQVEFLDPATLDIDMTIKSVDITVQIAPGWIE